MSIQPVEALQYALATEHAAVYGYGLLAAQLAGAARADALSALDQHRIRRDLLRAAVAAAGAVPQEAAPAYHPMIPATGASGATALAAAIEVETARAYGRLVEATTGDIRGSGARWLQDAAVRQARWRHTAARFPGLEAEPLPSAAPTAPSAQ